MMKVFVNDSKNDIFPIDNISGKTKLRELKQKIIVKKNIDTTAYDIDIIWNGANLDDDNEDLDYYDISNGVQLLYIRKFKAGLNIKIIYDFITFK